MIIIAIAGRAGSGKDTFGNALSALLYGQGYKAEIKKFAAKLKEVCVLLTGIPYEEWENNKTRQLGPEWNNMTLREFMQRLGTEAVRDGLCKNSWVNALFADLQEDSCWIITDLRFPQEYEAIMSNDGFLVRINREGAGAGNHSSETALDDFEFIEIDNNGTRSALHHKAIKLLVDMGIIKIPTTV